MAVFCMKKCQVLIEKNKNISNSLAKAMPKLLGQFIFTSKMIF